MKINGSLKLWWEEQMNNNFYYSDYKISSKNWMKHTVCMFCQGHSWQLQSQENYNSISEALVKTT